MTILFYILMVVAMLASGAIAVNKIHYRRIYGLPASKVKQLTWPSQQIIKAYNELPEENRPYSSLYHILLALDTKVGEEKINEHFTQRGYNGAIFSWNCRCYKGRESICLEYKETLRGINDIKESVEKQRHAIRVAGVEGGLSDLAELKSRLREESEVVQKITKEVVG